jgi:lipoprotein-releasing system permease protein
MAASSGAPFECSVGWRFVAAGRRGGGQSLTSFITAASMAGITLGVAALIVVMSVMNGFASEVRDRMLDAIAHVEVLDARGQALDDAPALLARLAREPGVVAAAPLVAQPALLARGEAMRAALLRGVDPAAEAAVTPLFAKLPAEQRQALTAGSRALLLGSELARVLKVQAGQTLTVVLPGTPGPGDGAAALRFVPFTVAGVFSAGHFEFDNGLALLHLQDAAELFGHSGATGVHLRLADQATAPAWAHAVAPRLGHDLVVREWTRSNRAWFESVQIQKRLIAIILTLIVAVAAFNLVATLVMTVSERRAQIAILRTLGASPRSIMAIFVVQGASAGVLGTALGVTLGLLVAFNVDVIVPALEAALGTRFLAADVYLITRMPSQVLASDVLPVALASVGLSLLATLYPSWRASRVAPAAALRDD